MRPTTFQFRLSTGRYLSFNSHMQLATSPTPVNWHTDGLHLWTMHAGPRFVTHGARLGKDQGVAARVYFATGVIRNSETGAFMGSKGWTHSEPIPWEMIPVE
jgi:hypothetical protein